MLSSLSSTQRDIVTGALILGPLVGLAYMAAGSDGAFVRAGKRGVVTGLAGASGLAVLGFLSAKDGDEELDNALEGAAIGGAVGLAGGVVGSFAYDGLWAASD